MSKRTIATPKPTVTQKAVGERMKIRTSNNNSNI